MSAIPEDPPSPGCFRRLFRGMMRPRAKSSIQIHTATQIELTTTTPDKNTLPQSHGGGGGGGVDTHDR